MTAVIDDLIREVSNWGRWGPDDQAGTVNHITPAKVAEAAALVRDGHIEQLGIPLGRGGPQITGSIRFNPLHFMTALHDYDVRPDGSAIADDVLTLPLQAGTQWDALAHYSHRGRLYGDRPASLVTPGGAQAGAISEVSGRIMTRGVLVDLPRHFGVASLEPGRAVGVADLEAALAATGTEIGPGDALLVRTGFLEHCRARGWTGYKSASPGLDVHTLPWIHRHRIAAVATDTTFAEVRPSTVPGVTAPFHLVGIVHMGLLIGEVFDLEGLAAACHRAGRHAFLLAAPPLAVTGGVGSPINPYAVL